MQIFVEGFPPVSLEDIMVFTVRGDETCSDC